MRNFCRQCWDGCWSQLIHRLHFLSSSTSLCLSVIVTFFESNDLHRFVKFWGGAGWRSIVVYIEIEIYGWDDICWNLMILLCLKSWTWITFDVVRCKSFGTFWPCRVPRPRRRKKAKNFPAFSGIWTHEYEYIRTWVEPLRPLGHECWRSPVAAHLNLYTFFKIWLWTVLGIYIHFVPKYLSFLSFLPFRSSFSSTY